jgi:hypothetical protein
MKRKQSVSEKQGCRSTDKESARGPAGKQMVNIEKQYGELCRLREKVQIEESRKRVSHHTTSKPRPS